MDKAQDPGVEGLSLELIRTSGRSIDQISQERMSQTRHMDPDLMGTTGLQAALDLCEARKAL